MEITEAEYKAIGEKRRNEPGTFVIGAVFKAESREDALRQFQEKGLEHYDYARHGALVSATTTNAILFRVPTAEDKEFFEKKSAKEKSAA